jgi:phage I-like protein
MPTPTRTIARATAVALAFEGDALPEWVQLTPPGPVMQTRDRDGRTFRIDAAAVVDEWRREHPNGMVVDYEHATEVRGALGQDAPAAGWVHEVALRDGAIWGRVEWTERAEAMIRAREYRFLSPAMATVDGEVVGIVHAGITNIPAFHRMAALARQQEEVQTLDKAIAEALGLASDASAADAVQAIGKLKDERRTALARAESPDPDRYVPKATHEAQVETARQQVRDEIATARAAEAAEAAVDEAIEQGKVAPADREFFVAAAKGDIEKFRAAMERTPEKAAPSGLDGRGPGKREGAAGLSEEEIAVCRAMGGDPEQLAAFKAKQKDR